MGFFSNLFKSKHASAKELKERGGVIVDVRSPQEFKAGHAKGSKNIPLGEVSGKIQQLRKLEKPIILCCASGMRSGRAVSMLRNAGIECANARTWQNADRL